MRESEFHNRWNSHKAFCKHNRCGPRMQQGGRGQNRERKRALVCPRRYWSGSRPVASKTASAAFFGSEATLSTAAGARILYLKGEGWRSKNRWSNAISIQGHHNGFTRRRGEGFLRIVFKSESINETRVFTLHQLLPLSMGNSILSSHLLYVQRVTQGLLRACI